MHCSVVQLLPLIMTLHTALMHGASRAEHTSALVLWEGNLLGVLVEVSSHRQCCPGRQDPMHPSRAVPAPAQSRVLLLSTGAHGIHQTPSPAPAAVPSPLMTPDPSTAFLLLPCSKALHGNASLPAGAGVEAHMH